MDIYDLLYRFFTFFASNLRCNFNKLTIRQTKAKNAIYQKINCILNFYSCKEQTAHLSVMLNNFIALLYADSEFPCKTCLAHKRCRTTVHQFLCSPISSCDSLAPQRMQISSGTAAPPFPSTPCAGVSKNSGGSEKPLAYKISRYFNDIPRRICSYHSDTECHSPI